MRDQDKSRAQLIAELGELRRRLAAGNETAAPLPSPGELPAPSRDQFRLMVEHAPMAMALSRGDTLLLLNNRFTALFGYVLGDIPTAEQWFLQAYPDPVYRAAVQKTWTADIEQARADPLISTPVREYSITCKDGSRLQVEVSFTLVEEVVYGIFTDVTARNQAEAARRDSEERFRQLAENVEGIFWLIDWLGPRVIYVSPAYEVIWGQPREHLYADPGEWLTRLHPEDRDRVIASWYAQVEKGGWEEIYRVIRPDGSLRWIRDRAFPIRDDQGRVYRLAGIAEDITDRKEAEDRLRQSEEKFRVAFESANDAIVWADVDTGIIVNCNPAAEELFQRPRTRIIGLHQAQLHPPDQQDYYRKIFRFHLETGLHSIEAQIVTAGGALKTVSITASTFQMGDVKVVQGIYRDITERQLLEESLRFHQLAIEHNADTAFWVAADGRIYYANNAACRVLGYSRRELLALSIFDIDPDLSRETWDEYWQRSRHRATYIMQTHHRTKDGRVFPVEVSITPVEFAGQVYHVSFARDISDRKQWEAALQESEQRFRTLAEASFEGIAISSDGITVDVNDQLLEMQGFSREEYLGKPVLDFIAPASRGAVAEAIRTGRLEPYEPFGLRKDGTTFPARVQARQVQIGGRQLRISVVRDISDWKAAEVALRQEKDFSEAIIDSLPGIFYMFDQDGRFIRWNQRLLEVTGYSAQSLALMQPLDFFREDRELISQKIREAFLTGETEVEAALLTKHGVTIPYYFSGRRVSWDGCNYLVGMAFDIAARKQAEAALRESEEFNRLIVSSIEEGIVVYDTRLHPRGWNHFMEKITGLPASRVLGRDIFDLFPFLREQGHDRFLRRVLVGETLEISDFHYQVPATGKEGWATAKGFPYLDARGEIGGIIVTVHDITERKRGEEERRRLKERMYQFQKLESLGVMAGGIAHDFNNLLMAILGNADLALHESSPAAPVRPYILEIERASQRAADLSRQMLAYSGKGKFEVENLDLSDLVREIAHLLDISISKKASLRFKLADHLPTIKADPTQVRQVIMNLIINASESLGGGPGVISLTTGVREFDQDYLAATYLNESLPAGDYVFLEVEDSGCGMDKEMQQKIFDPFYTTKFTGRGLGLAAVLGIVRGHRGAIKVDSVPGQGTKFTLIFPAASQPAEAVPARPAPSVDWQGHGTILLIDDEEVIRTVGQQMLRHLGFDVLMAADGRAGLDLLQELDDRPRCIILDLTMPNLSGEETFVELGTIAPEVPIIIVSGYEVGEVMTRFADLRLAEFLQKPYTLKDLREALEKVLGRHPEPSPNAVRK